MKPITDDVVFSIMKGLEKRERRSSASAQVRKISLPDRILGSIANKRAISVSLAKRQAKRTVSGVFCYVANAD